MQAGITDHAREPEIDPGVSVRPHIESERQSFRKTFLRCFADIKSRFNTHLFIVWGKRSHEVALVSNHGNSAFSQCSGVVSKRSESKFVGLVSYVVATELDWHRASFAIFVSSSCCSHFSSRFFSLSFFSSSLLSSAFFQSIPLVFTLSPAVSHRLFRQIFLCHFSAKFSRSVR